MLREKKKWSGGRGEKRSESVRGPRNKREGSAGQQSFLWIIHLQMTSSIILVVLLEMLCVGKDHKPADDIVLTNQPRYISQYLSLG